MKEISIQEGTVTITYPEDCGNAPKKVVLRDFTIAFVKKDTEAVYSTLSDHFRWEIIGQEIIEGKENVLPFLKQAEKITIKNCK